MYHLAPARGLFRRGGTTEILVYHYHFSASPKMAYAEVSPSPPLHVVIFAHAHCPPVITRVEHVCTSTKQLCKKHRVEVGTRIIMIMPRL